MNPAEEVWYNEHLRLIIYDARNRALDDKMREDRERQKKYYDLCVGLISTWSCYDLFEGYSLPEISRRYINNANHFPDDYDGYEQLEEDPDYIICVRASTGVNLFCHNLGNWGDWHDESDLVENWETNNWREQIWYKILYKHHFSHPCITEEEIEDIIDNWFDKIFN